MPTLRNPRHERFAQELAAGKTADAAYVLAGYRENRSNAARLNASQDIQKRVAEIQSVGAERAAVTVETLIAEAESARKKAMADKGGAAAAVAAITVKAKLAGLWRDKVAVTDPSGERAPRYIISDHPMTEEEWEREHWHCGHCGSRCASVHSHLRHLLKTSGANQLPLGANQEKSNAEGIAGLLKELLASDQSKK